MALQFAAGCAAVDDAEDGADDAFVTDGKVDGTGVAEGTPEAAGVLRVANEVAKTELRKSALQGGVGLAATATTNIVSRRVGADGTAGTSDDRPFQTLAQLDAVPYVGPVAFGKLLAYAQSHGYITTDGELRAGPVVCGLNGNGRLQEQLIAGTWVTTSTCSDASVCINGEAKTTPCQLPSNLGLRTESCQAGAWVQTSACTASCGANPYVGNVSINNVTDIAALAGRTGVTGTLTVNASDRSTLAGLEGLTCLGGLEVTNNRNLAGLDGLHNVALIAGELTVYGNEVLYDLGGLDRVRAVGSDMFIQGHVELAGLGALASVGGDVLVDTYQYDFVGLGGLKRIEGSLELAGTLYTTLKGFDSLTHIGGDVKFATDMYSPQPVGFPKVKAVGGKLSISGSFDTLDGVFPQLATIGGDLVFQLSRATSLGLSALQIVRGNVEIINSDTIRAVSKFRELRVVDGSLIMRDSERLGGGTFPVLEAVGRDLSFTNNLHSYVSDSIANELRAPKLRRVGGKLAVTSNGISRVVMSALRQVVGGIAITDQRSLCSITMPALVSTGPVLSIERNAHSSCSIMSFDFSSLQEAEGDVILKDNYSKVWGGTANGTELWGLPPLKRVAGDLIISNSVSWISALSDLESVGGDLTVSRNELTRVSPLLGLTHLGGDLRLEEPAVYYCHLLEISDQLRLAGWTGTPILSGATSSVCPQQ